VRCKAWFHNPGDRDGKKRSRIMKTTFYHSSITFLMLVFVSLFAGATDLSANEKVLRICDSVSDKEYTLDPHKIRDVGDSNQVFQLIDCLLAFDREDNHLIPGLATGWKRIDPVTIQFKLRKGVRFHNGEEFDSKATKFSLERMINPEIEAPMAAFYSSLERVDIVDKYTVNIVTKYPDALILQKITLLAIVSPKYVKEAGREGMAKHPVGTGPFKFKEWVKGERIVFTANREYWKPRVPKIDRVEFYFYDVDTRLKKFMAGELDMISNIKPTIALRVAKGKDNKVIKRDSFLSLIVCLNTLKAGPLKNKLVRKALNHAVDVPKIIKYGARGNGTPIATMAMKGDVGFNPDLKPYSYDPEKAKQLLAEAGYPNGIKLTAVASPKIGGIEGPLARIVKSQLKAVGVTVEMRTGSFINKIAIPRLNKQVPQLDFFMLNSPSPYAHIAFLQSIFFYSKGMAASIVNDLRYDKLFEQVIHTLDPEGHIKACYKLEEYFKAQAYCINMYQARRIYAVKKNMDFMPALNGMLYLEELVIN
jgi:peptide/nickel transport system substrate-binding protein